MKANELRIGNWINDIMCGFSQVTGEDIANWDAINASPIPITPEILDKAGFVETEDGSYLIPQKYKGELSFEIKYYGSINGSQKGYMLETGFGWHVYNNGLQYLHQLQNLYFALTGEELNIDL